MAKRDKITNTSHSENNAGLRFACGIAAIVFGTGSWFFFSNGNAESGSWSAFMAICAFLVAVQIQVEWTSRSHI